MWNSKEEIEHKFKSKYTDTKGYSIINQGENDSTQQFQSSRKPSSQRRNNVDRSERQSSLYSPDSPELNTKESIMERSILFDTQEQDFGPAVPLKLKSNWNHNRKAQNFSDTDSLVDSIEEDTWAKFKFEAANLNLKNTETDQPSSKYTPNISNLITHTWDQIFKKPASISCCSESENGKGDGSDYKYLNEVAECDLSDDDNEGKVFRESRSSNITKNLMKCGNCLQGIENISEALHIPTLNTYFHKSGCFECLECKKALNGTSLFVPHNGEAYCVNDYLRLFVKVCAGCNGKIRDNNVVYALGRPYHLGHISCKICTKPIKGPHVEHDGNVYCREDFNAMSSKHVEECGGCKQPIRDGERLIVASKCWHSDCLACNVCNLPLNKLEFYVKDDQPVCARHFCSSKNTNESRTICDGCHKGIQGTCVDVKPLAQKFHPSCWTCKHCNITLDSGYFLHEKEAYCEKDFNNLHGNSQKQSNPRAPSPFRGYPQRNNTPPISRGATPPFIPQRSNTPPFISSRANTPPMTSQRSQGHPFIPPRSNTPPSTPSNRNRSTPNVSIPRRTH